MKDLNKLRLTPEDFSVKAVIGRGHFGEVYRVTPLIRNPEWRRLKHFSCIIQAPSWGLLMIFKGVEKSERYAHTHTNISMQFMSLCAAMFRFRLCMRRVQEMCMPWRWWRSLTFSSKLMWVNRQMVICMCIASHTHACTHTHTHMHAHACTHTHAHTHTCTHRLLSSLKSETSWHGPPVHGWPLSTTLFKLVQHTFHTVQQCCHWLDGVIVGSPLKATELPRVGLECRNTLHSIC